jgi:hypothetical protein
MIPTLPAWFEELFIDRNGWVESTRKNGFNFQSSIVDKYVDPAHFIYELLQNADDQKAGEVRFELHYDHLAFSHNGQTFSETDVRNITGIGNSEKSQEANKIGCFGLGFKSVFKITDRPEIYALLKDQPFAFAIEHLVVPVALPVENGISGTDTYHTRFVFPFKEATFFTAIRDKLRLLGTDIPLLFLNHMHTIKWQTEMESGVYMCKKDGNQYTLSEEITTQNGIERHAQTYWISTRKVQVGGSKKDLSVRLAFRLDTHHQLQPEPKATSLHVYFPTQQHTGLKFRMHGPFLLTDNRENIKDNDENKRLITECAALLVETLEDFKEHRLLTVSVLNMLPIQSDTLALPLLQPLFDHVREALRQRNLLPTYHGSFTRSTRAKLARSSELRTLLTSKQLELFYGKKYAWLADGISEDRTPGLRHYLMSELNIEEVRPDTFVQKICVGFLEKQTDQWMIRFYKFLSQQRSLYSIRSKEIIRLEDGTHVRPDEAYLSTGQLSTFPTVKRIIAEDKAVYAFLKDLGLTEPDVIDEVIRSILPRYAEKKVDFDDTVTYADDLQLIDIALKNVI